MKKSKLSYKIFPQLNVFTSHANGVITYQDIFNHVVELMTENDYYVGINGFYDFSEVTAVNGTLDIFKQVASGMSDREIIIKPARTAIVLPEGDNDIRQAMEYFLEIVEDSLIDYQLYGKEQWQQALHHVGLKQLPKSTDNVFL